MTEILYQYTVPAAAHWSLRVRRGTSLRLTDVEGGANLGMMFYNPEDLLEKYNAPDTLKCQHTFKLTRGNCLYSDMGRIFCSIVEDSFGWHDTVCGNSNKAMVAEKWGEKDYQAARNQWHQNGYDSFLVELAKYGLNGKDLASNLNLFSKVVVDDAGNLSLDSSAARAGAQVTLRFEMDTLVILHTCPHPLNPASDYPYRPVHCEMMAAPPVSDDDFCKNLRPENQRGFANNRLYHFFH
ncbi:MULTISPECIES: urea amidolyase associated protein UAAP1 [unclassified Ketobacter]|uniref:urea amidolyase associated protein UAAP1 n=1 Tax=unclassified Ketobacter TaxID=2639109 RepID=UPI000F14C1F3|nr:MULTISPECIES: urea amidolyase associated protein UAAP1 [unclassified Ketobacter]RLT91775.1 MAG: urea carboxylase-associated family protein [Ketobacter sp. GenoA1]RLT93708.1 MAG: urea carboxylase-associated family protein [Ketobacter sp.]